MSPLHPALAGLARTRILFILRGLSPDDAARVGVAVERAGFSHLEITADSPGMPGLLRDIAKAAPGLTLGAGTVLGPESALAAIDAGATFLVSPHTDPALIKTIVEHDVAAIPGAMSPTEILGAHRAGASAVKLFPGPVVSPAGLSDIFGPFPFLRIIPTGGIALDAIPQWLSRGALAVGVGRRVLLGEPRGDGEGAIDAARLADSLERLAAIRDRSLAS